MCNSRLCRLLPAASHPSVRVTIEPLLSCLALTFGEGPDDSLTARFCLVLMTCALVLCLLMASGVHCSLLHSSALQTIWALLSLFPALDVMLLVWCGASDWMGCSSSTLRCQCCLLWGFLLLVALLGMHWRLLVGYCSRRGGAAPWMALSGVALSITTLLGLTSLMDLCALLVDSSTSWFIVVFLAWVLRVYLVSQCCVLFLSWPVVCAWCCSGAVIILCQPKMGQSRPPLSQKSEIGLPPSPHVRIKSEIG